MGLAMPFLALWGLWTLLLLDARCLLCFCPSKHSEPAGFDDPAGTADCSSQQSRCLSFGRTVSPPPFFLIYFKLTKKRKRNDTSTNYNFICECWFPLEMSNLSWHFFPPAGFRALISDDIVWALAAASFTELQRKYPRKLCIAFHISSLPGNVPIVSQWDSSAEDMGLNELITSGLFRKPCSVSIRGCGTQMGKGISGSFFMSLA